MTLYHHSYYRLSEMGLFEFFSIPTQKIKYGVHSLVGYPLSEGAASVVGSCHNMLVRECSHTDDNVDGASSMLEIVFLLI